MLGILDGCSLSTGLEASLWLGLGGYVCGYAAGLVVDRIAMEQALQAEQEAVGGASPPEAKRAAEDA